MKYRKYTLQCLYLQSQVARTTKLKWPDLYCNFDTGINLTVPSHEVCGVNGYVSAEPDLRQVQQNYENTNKF